MTSPQAQSIRPASLQRDKEATAQEVHRRDIRFDADDGFPLTGTLFEGDGQQPLVLISSATAVPRGFYAAFATAAVKAGARGVLIYDYRGTGDSMPSKGWSKRIGMADWGLRDMPAAAKALDAVAPGHPMVGVGQSYGGQALGLSGISNRFTRYGMIAVMSGYHRGLDDKWAGPRMFLLGVPLSYLFSNMPKWMRLGEPIPATVFRDWARWCSMPDYFFDDPGLRETKRFAEVRTPILSLRMSDDPWGTERAVVSLMKHYDHAPIERRWISPEDAGGPIGHLGFFRSRFATTLWPPFLSWLLNGVAFTAGSPPPQMA
ncbi:alpha/beta fold hydrolase [Mesorhizobium sp. UC22_110]|uniref:alpha/beta hydrolase family protein n=1 Tax=unclassified Mesorhizobium TaxID=325217 RepID=UPI00366AA4B2